MSDSPAIDALIDLALYQCQDAPMPFWPEHRAESHAEPGDENAPLLSEAFLYPLIGKEDARAIRGRFEALGRALGLDPADLRRRIAAARRARTRYEIRIPASHRDQRREIVQRLRKPRSWLGAHQRLVAPAAWDVRLLDLDETELESIRQKIEFAGFSVEIVNERLLMPHEIVSEEADATT